MTLSRPRRSNEGFFRSECRQARVETIKANSKYTDAIGQQLRIVSTSGEFDPKSYKAELGQPRQTGPNTVTIPFRKAGGEVAGINLYRQGNGDKEPELVGFFVRTPVIDNAPASSGKAEQRTYTARAVINDKEIGQPSDAVQVTMTAG